MPMDLVLNLLQLMKYNYARTMVADTSLRIGFACQRKKQCFLGRKLYQVGLKTYFPILKFLEVSAFSLYFAGKSKLSRIPERSTVVSFSINEIYATDRAN